MLLPTRRPLGRLAAIVLLLLSLAVPGSAVAHAALDLPTPADGATVVGPPDEVAGTFTQDLDPNGSSMELRDAAGAVIATGTVDPGNARRMIITEMPALVAGEYEVRWTTLSSEDGELERDTWTFTVVTPPTEAPTTPPPATAPTKAPTAPTASPTGPSPTGPEPSSTPTSADASASPGPPSVGDDSSSGGSDAVLPIVGALIVLGAGAVYLVRRQRPTSPR